MILRFGLPKTLTAMHNDLFERLKLQVGLDNVFQMQEWQGYIELDVIKFAAAMKTLSLFAKYKGVRLDVNALQQMRADLATALVNVTEVLTNHVPCTVNSSPVGPARDPGTNSDGVGAAGCCFAFDSCAVADIG